MTTTAFKSGLPDIPDPVVPALRPQPQSLSKSLGELTGGLLRAGAPMAGSVANLAAKSPWLSAALGGLGLAGAGYGGSKLLNLMSPVDEETEKKRTRGMSLGAGISGLLAGALLGKELQRHKQASVFAGGPDAQLIAKVTEDFTLTSGMQTALVNHMSKLDDGSKFSLLRLLQGVTGSAIGLVIARYLLKMGMTGQILFMLAGGAIGDSFGRSNGVDLSNTNMYGDSYRY